MLLSSYHVDKCFKWEVSSSSSCLYCLLWKSVQWFYFLRRASTQWYAKRVDDCAVANETFYFYIFFFRVFGKIYFCTAIMTWGLSHLVKFRIIQKIHVWFVPLGLWETPYEVNVTFVVSLFFHMFWSMIVENKVLADEVPGLPVTHPIALLRFPILTPWWWRWFAPLKCWSTSMRLHSVISQKAVIIIHWLVTVMEINSFLDLTNFFWRSKRFCLLQLLYLPSYISS
jgi:hypothetical protein